MRLNRDDHSDVDSDISKLFGTSFRTWRAGTTSAVRSSSVAEAVPERSLGSNWVVSMYGQRPRCKGNLTFSELVGCSHVFGLFVRRAWPLALM